MPYPRLHHICTQSVQVAAGGSPSQNTPPRARRPTSRKSSTISCSQGSARAASTCALLRHSTRSTGPAARSVLPEVDGSSAPATWPSPAASLSAAAVAAGAAVAWSALLLSVARISASMPASTSPCCRPSAVAHAVDRCAASSAATARRRASLMAPPGTNRPASRSQAARSQEAAASAASPPRCSPTAFCSCAASSGRPAAASAATSVSPLPTLPCSDEACRGSRVARGARRGAGFG